MSTFLFPSLAVAALGLIFVPVLIHLINLLRHRRVQWAAMEFLLQSQRRNRTWVMLKQLLLLLMRMLAMAAVALMVSQPILRTNWAALLGGGNTHHIVLLDDSFSMADSWQKTSGFQQGLEVVRRLGKQAVQQNSAQTFTLLRFSHAGGSGSNAGPDLAAQTVDSQFTDLLETKCGSMHVSQTAAGPAAALDAVIRMPDGSADEKRIIYIVSDFRANQWDNPTALRTTLMQLASAEVKVHLVQCVDQMRPNLAIASLRPLGGTRAVGVPLLMQVEVKNFGMDAVRDVPVELKEDGDHDLPPLRIESIRPGEAAVKQFQVAYLSAGEHRLEARIPGDAVAIDNSRYSVLYIPAYVPVLIVDGDTSAATNRNSDANFLIAALAAPGATATGIKPQLEQPRYLREKPLTGFHAIYLANLERLDSAEIEALEKYIKQGGGVAFFLGEQTSADFMKRQLYRNGEGLFPVPLVARTELLVDKLDKTPDLQITSHPIFKIFAGERNPFISSVNVEKYFAVDRSWKPEANAATAVIARLRNGVPLAIDHRFGKGHVVAFLTTAAPRWNNWGRENPSFPIAIQELQSYLAMTQQAETSHPVGNPLELTFDAARFTPQVRFMSESKGAVGTSVVDANLSPKGLTATLHDTDVGGFYEAQLTGVDGHTESRRFARNVDADEGNLRMLDGQQLAVRLKGLDYQFIKAEDLTVGTQDLAGRNLSSFILYGLVALLLAEQALAYSASYHASREARR